jgi:integrase
MLSFAVDRELIEHNPLAGLKKSKLVGAPVERNRVLSPQEVTALHQAIPGARMNARSAAAIWLMLATGARLGELMGAVWAEDLPADGPARQQRQHTLQTQADEVGVKLGWVDLANKQWHLPSTKNERPHTIHLSPFAMRHFSELAALRERNPSTQALTPWVFPSRDLAKPVCPKSLGKQLADRQREPSQRMSGRSLATEALRLPGGRWTAHDLRRTAGTLMASLGVSGDTIDEALNHVIESRVRRTYIRDRREADQARAFEALGALLSDLTAQIAPSRSNVLNIRAA